MVVGVQERRRRTRAWVVLAQEEGAECHRCVLLRSKPSLPTVANSVDKLVNSIRGVARYSFSCQRECLRREAIPSV